jgi:hypothetical protein
VVAQQTVKAPVAGKEVDRLQLFSFEARVGKLLGDGAFRGFILVSLADCAF